MAKKPLAGALDDVFRPKGAGTGAPVGAPVRAPAAASDESKKKASTSIYLPVYVLDQFRDWLDQNPDDTQATMIMRGLKGLGFDIRDDDLKPERKRRR